MLTSGEEYQIHYEDITTVAKIGHNISGSIGYTFACFINSIVIYDICSGRTIDNDMILIFVVSLIIGVFSIYTIYKSYFPKDKPICIGREGIVDDEGNIYSWNKITNAYVHRESKTLYLYIRFKNDSAQSDNVCLPCDSECRIINLSGYHVDENKVAEVIETWSGRDIGHYEDYIKDDYIKQQVKEGKITEEQSKILDEKLSLYTPYFQKKQKEYKMYIIWLLPILVIVYFISKYLCDVKTPLDMYKWFSIIRFLSLRSGFLVLYVFCLGLVGDYKTKKLRRNPDLKDLSEKELDHLLDVHEMKESPTPLIVCIFILVIIWCLVAAYTILVDYGVLS